MTKQPESEPIARPADASQLSSCAAAVPFLPLLYVAWADGELTSSELKNIQAKLAEQSWPEEGALGALQSWLRPEAPPTPIQLQSLLQTIRALGSDLLAGQRRSLADLGLELGHSGANEAGEQPTAELRRALAEIEETLGVAGAEVSDRLLVPHSLSASARDSPGIDSDALSSLLESPHQEVRRQVKDVLRQPRFQYVHGLGTASYREQVLRWCRVLAGHGFGALNFPAAYGGASNTGQFLAAFETLAFHDLSLLIKFGVQFGLFGGSILMLGTERHHRRYLAKTGTLELPGCFAMTELGHGSNVYDIETEAHYHPEPEEFEIITPSESARKEYIGNAACHGQLATVFAQLFVGGERHGVHALLVPIRGLDGQIRDGVQIEDCGEKLGLNGVDNGRIWFDHVRVPRENLLNRFADVSADGEYSSSIPSPSRRFFTMLGALVAGRVSIALGALSASKSGLAIAIRYGDERRQFGPEGGQEFRLLDYRSHQRRLMPPLAASYALHFALRHLASRFAERSEKDEREVEALAAGLKAYSTWNNIATLQTARECCGGQGYLALNRFAALKADTDIFATFEGDNTVLMLLVAKGLLTEYRRQFEDLRPFTLLNYLGQRAGTALTELNPVVTRLSDESHLLDAEFHLAAFRYREESLLRSVAARLRHRIQEGQDSYHAFNDCQDHLLSTAQAHVERVVLEQFIEAVAACELETSEPGTYERRASEPAASGQGSLRDPLQSLCALFALSRIEADRGWFQESGYLSSGKSKAIRAQVNKLCAELRPDAVALVDAFGIPNELLGAPIATR